MTARKTDAIMTTADKLALIEPQFAALDTASTDLRDLVVCENRTPSMAIRQAAAMQTLRELLTPEVMAPVLALKGNALGFLTDESDRKSYSSDEIRDAVIEAIGHGASLTGNRFNVISGRCYLTKAYMADRLDAVLGRGQWLFIHGVPAVKRGEKMARNKRTGNYEKKEGVVGALVETTVKWCDAGSWREETLKHAIKGDDYATADSYLGKADRKCGAWLLARITGQHVPEGEADDAITVEGREVPTGPDPEPERKPVAPPKAKAKPSIVKPGAPAMSDVAESASLVEQFVAMVEASGIPEIVAVDYYRAAGKIVSATGGLRHVAADSMRAALEDPAQTAAAISEWADQLDGAEGGA